MPIYLAIDANIFLRFFEYSKDSLTQLEKLEAAIKHGHLKVFVSTQVLREVRSRRHEVVKRSIQALESKKAPDNFPRIADPYDEYKEIRASGASFNKALTALVKKLTEDAQNKSLAADLALKALFSKATIIDCSDQVISDAERRIKFGLPPGKTKLGDAITWETLLDQVVIKPGENFYFVTEDSDYINPLDQEILPELESEWRLRKKGAVRLYTSLGKFFADNFPDIEIADEMEKLSAISKLIYSSSFASTHNAIASLSPFKNYTANEIKKLVDALINNNQIRWMATDEDAAAFYKTLVVGNENLLDADVLAEFSKIYAAPDSPDDEIPF